MKKDKQLKNLINKLVELSFDAKGNLLQEKVQKCVRILKALPSSKAILALEGYAKGIRRGVGKSTLQIWSAKPLTAGQVDQILDQMKNNFPITDINTNLNPSLFGGVRVKIGDVVYDDTVGKKIIKLQDAIRD